VTVVSNDVGIIGGVQAWDVLHLRTSAAMSVQSATESPDQMAQLLDSHLDTEVDPEVGSARP
jgi:hypothetical protein